MDASGAMRCHSASGEAMGSVGAIVGATLFDEELLYVDREFLGPGLLSLDALCDGGAQDVASVWKTNPGVQFWTHIYAKVQGSILTSQRVNARRSGLAVVVRDAVRAARADAGPPRQGEAQQWVHRRRRAVLEIGEIRIDNGAENILNSSLRHRHIVV